MQTDAGQRNNGGRKVRSKKRNTFLSLHNLYCIYFRFNVSLLNIHRTEWMNADHIIHIIIITKHQTNASWNDCRQRRFLFLILHEIEHFFYFFDSVCCLESCKNAFFVIISHLKCTENGWGALKALHFLTETL